MAYFQIAATPEQIQDGFRDRLDLLIKDIEPLGVFRTSMDEKPHGCLIVFNVFLAGVTLENEKKIISVIENGKKMHRLGKHNHRFRFPSFSY